jgi:amino acid transporter
VIYALIAVVAITALNVAGTRESKVVQKVLTAGLAAAIAAVILAGFFGDTRAPAATAAAASSGGAPFSQLALIFILLTYGGWNEAAYITAEVRDGRRNIVRALVIGILVVTVLYVLLNLAYVNVMGLDGMKESKALASDMMKLTFGEAGAVVLSLIVIAASLSTLNATVFTGARTNYAVGRDYAIFSALGHWKEGTNAPVNALLLQGAIAIALVLLSSLTPDGFETMVAYTAPAFWLFFMLTGISLFILRKQAPAQPNPFRVPLYPITPILFILMCAFMLWSSTSYALSKNPGSIGAQLGIGVLLLGIPVMLIARRRRPAA